MKSVGRIEDGDEERVLVVLASVGELSASGDVEPSRSGDVRSCRFRVLSSGDIEDGTRHY